MKPTDQIISAAPIGLENSNGMGLELTAASDSTNNACAATSQ